MSDIIYKVEIMDEKNKGLERLCKIYDILTDDEKEKVIRLADSLLHSQKIISGGKTESKEELKVE